MYEILTEIAAQEKDPIKVQELIRSKFHELLNVGPIPSWKPGDPISPAEKRVLVGVDPSWNAVDRNLLEWLEKLIINGNTKHIIIQAFDAGGCESHEDLRRYIPCIQEVFQFPVVGVWEFGIEGKHASGYAARELLREIMRTSEK